MICDDGYELVSAECGTIYLPEKVIYIKPKEMGRVGVYFETIAQEIVLAPISPNANGEFECWRYDYISLTPWRT